VGRLEALDAVRVGPTGEVFWSVDHGDGSPDFGAFARDVVDAQERRRQVARSRVDLLRGYAETRGCRRRYLLNALGEEFEPPCGHCDNCLAGHGGDDLADGVTGTLRLSDRVVHTTFGEGEVSRVEGDRVVVRFESMGYRTLALPDVLDSGLLRRHDRKERPTDK
jgi:ATP-dependent DNA helicase RecQ